MFSFKSQFLNFSETKKFSTESFFNFRGLQPLVSYKPVSYKKNTCNCSLMAICRSSPLNQKSNLGLLLLKRFVDLVRLCYLHIISRNRSNTLLLINVQKTKTCPTRSTAAKVICSGIRILTV